MDEERRGGIRPEALKPVRAPRRVTVLPEEAHALARALAQRIDGEVRFDDGSRALYATDASNYRHVPIGVVLPRSKADVIETVRVCRDFGAPIVSRGGGTALAGQTCNVAVVIDHSKYHHGMVALEAARREARVKPGTVLDVLRRAANEHDLTFGPDPATHDHCTLGGMIGNNSCGPHSIMAGRTSDNVLELEVLTYDGLRLTVGPTAPEELAAIIAAGGRRGALYRGMARLADRYQDLIRRRYPKIPRRVSGYNLDELLPENGFHVARALVGSESTLVTVLEARLRLIPWPRARALLVLGYPDVYQAGDDVVAVMQQRPIALEGLDERLLGFVKKKGAEVENLRHLPDGNAFLLVEFGGDTPDEAGEAAERARQAMLRHRDDLHTRVVRGPEEQARLWKVRESGLGATARVPGMRDTWPGWEDSAVPPERVGDYLRALRALYDRYDYQPSLYGHFGDGCVHCRVDFDLESAAGIAKWRRFLGEAADLVVRHGGSISGEHGDGQARGELLDKMFGEELVGAMREFKRLWDPENRMNPGKVIDPYPITANLRLGPGYHRPVETRFHYPDDDGDLERASLRCVGVGKCRREAVDGGLMCPSYMATREEMHSTRGRAHLLFEMLRGDELSLWKDEHVKESLDLCLACKGCKGECPVNVDLATYKAEFLSHYYQHRLRPRPAYAMGLVDVWARLASTVPGLANGFAQEEPFASWLKRLGGIAPERRMPAFAAQTFKRWFFRRGLRNPDGEPVVLWADTFNNHFFPETLVAATEVLEAAGRRVMVQRQHLCCGRPLYDFGMLDRAGRLLDEILAALKGPIARGVPVVGLEPSCVSVLKDELVGLRPRREDAKQLAAQACTFGQFLRDHAADWTLPRLERRAIVQGHCHHQALWHMDDEKQALESLGMEVEVLDAGCCGMAGAVGFEKGEPYEVSQKIADQRLLPKVRSAPLDTFVVADGFSCREQISQNTHRRGLHVAEVVRMAMLQGPEGPHGDFPENSWLRKETDYPRISPWKPLLFGAAIIAAAVGGAYLWRRK